MKLPLSNHNSPALISPEDVEISHYNWYFSRGYAKAWIPEMHKPMWLHRLIMLRQGIHSTNKNPIEHLNGQGLDCRRKNLVLSTQSANLIRASRGQEVTFHKASGKWYAQITFQKQQISLGLFKEKELAEVIALGARDQLLQLIASTENLTISAVKSYFRKGK
jgi:hypothetical protein